MKNRFSLVSVYISWSSLRLPTPRMRKTSDSCKVSAAHPLITRGSCRLFRFSPFCYVTKGADRSLTKADLLCAEISERGAFIPEVKFGVSSSETAVFHNVVAQS